MTYTILPGDKAPRFEKLLATDGSLYSQEDFEDKPFKVIFFTCNHCPYVTGSDELTRKVAEEFSKNTWFVACLLYTSPSPRDLSTSRMPSSA